MLKSNTSNSVVENLSAFSSPLNEDALKSTDVPVESSAHCYAAGTSLDESENNNNAISTCSSEPAMETTSIGAQQLSAAFLQSLAPPISKTKVHLKELLQKQNKIYIDLSAEKFKLDNAEVSKLHEMMHNVKVYREKLLKIKKQMQNIYQRTKVLKKRAINIQTSKEKELQSKLLKQQQEESLIGKPSQ